MYVSVRFPFSGLSDEKWHHVAVSVSAKRLALYVDCSLLESVDWVYHSMGIRTDGLLVVGGIIEGFETPFEVSGFHPVLSVYPALQLFPTDHKKKEKQTRLQSPILLACPFLLFKHLQDAQKLNLYLTNLRSNPQLTKR